jgi:FkbM family methyltransferase
LERSSRGRIVRRRLGNAGGNRTFYASPECSLIWALPWATAEDNDPGIGNFCREFIGKEARVWDFGAHIGIFSFTAAALAGPKGFVLAVEADPFLSQLMIKSEELRPHDTAPCTILTAAVGLEAGFATIEVPERSRAANAVSGKSECTQRGGIRSRFDTPFVTASQLGAIYPLPNVVKMDIEGCELDALIGGQDVFLKSRPIMLLEVYDNIAEGTTRLLKEWGYRLFDADDTRTPKHEVSSTRHNTIAIPD